jgi:hypothetical protein
VAGTDKSKKVIRPEIQAENAINFVNENYNTLIN